MDERDSRESEAQTEGSSTAGRVDHGQLRGCCESRVADGRRHDSRATEETGRVGLTHVTEFAQLAHHLFVEGLGPQLDLRSAHLLLPPQQRGGESLHKLASLSLQMHHHRAEHWIVVSGTARVTRGEETFLLSENQSTYIPLGTTHRLENPGRLPLEMIEVQSGSYLGEDDIVRFEDTYGRQ